MFVTLKARLFTDATGVYTEIPVLLTPTGILEPLLDYCLSRTHDRSIAWMIKVHRSVRVFLEYLQMNPVEREPYRLFRNFAQRLYTGTFDRTSGMDPSGLCWLPRTATDARHIVTHLTDFFDWLAEMRPSADTINPRYAGDLYDRITDEAAYQYRRDRAFLGHNWAANAESEELGRRVRSKRLPKVEKSEPPAFPEERFMELLLSGFKTGRHYDYRNMLITLLLHGAGFRESETFHLYIGDVFPDPSANSRASVLIHHPTYGAAPSGWLDAFGKPKKGNRAAYLAEKFGLVPRTDLMDSRHAGWKGGTHDAPYYKQAYWFPSEYGEMFLKIWYRYLDEVVRIERHHPFAFINLRNGLVGGIYGLAQYNKAHAVACARIGLTAAKAFGTTPHGHRHAYGRRLENAGVEKEFIRRFMHHASPESQEVYTQPTTKEIIAALEAGAQRLRYSIGETMAQSFSTVDDLSLQ